MTTAAPTAPRIILINAGLKRGALPKADLYLDCRGIANPFHDPKLGAMSGDTEAVQEWVEERSRPAIDAFMQSIEDGLSRLSTRRSGDPLSRPFIICPFCAHGIHRSKAVKHLLKKRLVKEGYDAKIRGWDQGVISVEV